MEFYLPYLGICLCKWFLLKVHFIEELSYTVNSKKKYTVSKANVDSSKNILLLKNPQFLPNHYETLPK